MQKNWRPDSTIRIYSQDIGMEFDIAILMMKIGKSETKEGIELPNDERTTTFREKENRNTYQ